MDFAKILGAVLNEHAQRSPYGQRTIDRSVRMPSPVDRAPQGAGSGPLGGLLAGVLQEALRRNGQPLPGWQGQPQPPFPNAPGFPHVVQRPGFPDHGHQHQPPCHDYQDRSATLLRAMIQAAKADGRIDPAEQQGIVGRMGQLSPAEVQFLQQEFARPIDVHGFAHSVPPGMEADVYAASLMAIRLDTQYEGQYLIELAQCLRLPREAVDQIHRQLGAPCLG